MVAPQLPEPMRAALGGAAIDIRNGSCAAAVYLGRQVLVADVSKDGFWLEQRDVALAAGLRAAWSTPIKAAAGTMLGSLGVYRGEPGLPRHPSREIMARAAQLAGIAIGRRLAEEALRGSEAKFRGLFETIAEGVYQSGRDGRLLSVNPAFVAMMGYDSAESLYALPSAAALYWDPGDRAEFARRIEADGRCGTRSSSCAAATGSSSWFSRTRAPCATLPADRGYEGYGGRHHRAQARRAGSASPRRSAPR